MELIVILLFAYLGKHKMPTPKYSKYTCTGCLEDEGPECLVTMTVAVAGPFSNSPLMVYVVCVCVNPENRVSQVVFSCAVRN